MGGAPCVLPVVTPSCRPSLLPPSPSAATQTTGGYLESCTGNSACFSGVPLATAQDDCCKDVTCAGFSYAPAGQSGCYKLDTNCGSVTNGNYDGYYKPTFTPTACGPADITVNMVDVGFAATDKVLVRDIWARADLGVFSGSFTGKAVPCHGTGFYRFTKQ